MAAEYQAWAHEAAATRETSPLVGPVKMACVKSGLVVDWKLAFIGMAWATGSGGMWG